MKSHFSLKDEVLPIRALNDEFAASEVEEHRCHCGQLLARAIPGGIELKCKRCKRVAVVNLERSPA